MHRHVMTEEKTELDGWLWREAYRFPVRIVIWDELVPTLWSIVLSLARRGVYLFWYFATRQFQCLTIFTYQSIVPCLCDVVWYWFVVQLKPMTGIINELDKRYMMFPCKCLGKGSTWCLHMFPFATNRPPATAGDGQEVEVAYHGAKVRFGRY